MALNLSDRDRHLLGGADGEAARLAMSIMTRMAEAYGADELMDVSQAHRVACGLVSEPSLEFAERLAELGARVAISARQGLLVRGCGII